MANEDQKGNEHAEQAMDVCGGFVVAAVVLIGAGSSASAADEWFVLGEQMLKSVDQGVEIKSQGGRWTKDVKQMKMSVEGADVELRRSSCNGTIAAMTRSRISVS